MKMKFGAIVVDGRNKIGGHVASKNRAGSYLRTKVTPVNPRSPAQVSQRALLASLAQSWRGLTDAQRATFINAVSDYKKTDIFGDMLKPSGFNLYCKLNANLVNVTAGQITEAPAPVGVSVFDSVALTAGVSPGALTMAVSPATLPSGEVIIVRATPAMSAGKSFVKSEFRQIAVLNAIVAGSVNLLAAYQAKFGTISQVDSRIFIEVVHVNDLTGQVSQAQQASAIVID